MKRALLIGESWMIHMIHQKGFDSFTTTEYHKAAIEFSAALRSGGWEVTHVAAHEVEQEVPTHLSGLEQFDLVILSDVGANTLLLTKGVFTHSISEGNRLKVLRAWVNQGGGLLMVGGYLSFAGIDGKAMYRHSPIAEILPVGIEESDDRMEHPDGAEIEVLLPNHPALGGVGAEWPKLLGFNRTIPVDGAEILASIDGHPLISVREVGAGRTAVFTSDMSPHWAPPPFLEWAGYAPMWCALSDWAAGK